MFGHHCTSIGCLGSGFLLSDSRVTADQQGSLDVSSHLRIDLAEPCHL